MKASSLLLALALSAAGCSGGRAEPADPAPQTGSARTHEQPVYVPEPEVLEAAARADSLRDSFNQADVDFISGMIHHHAQALEMAQLAPSHGASGPILVLSGRIINAQRDEIALMSQWLRERGQPVPDVAHMDHGPHGQHMEMPGMLTPEQMQRLDDARGVEFDRLFLTYMIQHHEGAIVMVNELFNTYGAVQGDAIFKLASDINVDQNTEIERMRLMLRDMVIGTEGQ